MESTRISNGTVPSQVSLRNNVVDAGDEVNVDGEWRMAPKVDIVEDSSRRQTGRHGTMDGHVGRRGPLIVF